MHFHISGKMQCVIAHFREKFHSFHRQGFSPKKEKKDDSFYSFETCATDTESIKKIEGALKEKLFKELITGIMI